MPLLLLLLLLPFGRTGRITGWSLLYYLLSMLLALALGIGLVYALRPGKGKPFDDDTITECSRKNSGLDTSSYDSCTMRKILPRCHGTVFSLLTVMPRCLSNDVGHHVC